MSALDLRIFACVCMLLDHIGYCLNLMTLRYIGRLAFPIYVFLMVNGFRHTGNRFRYAGRFLLFALISQIPYALMVHNQYDHPQWNVMATLLMGLLVIRAGELLRKHSKTKYFCLLPALAVYGACYFNFIDSDYDGKGILLATVFWFFEGKALWILLGSLFTVMNHTIVGAFLSLLNGRTVALPTQWELTQLLSLLSLPFIFSYNGTVGKHPSSPIGKKALQLSFYLFYPAHMLLLWFLFRK